MEVRLHGPNQVAFDPSELEAALAAAGVGVWRWDLRSDRVVWSPETAALFGLPPDGFDGTFQGFVDRVHPEDVADVAAAVEAALASRAADYQVEHRVLVDGEVRWVHGRGRVLCDATGSPTGMSGVALDVTENRLVRERLRADEARFRLFADLASDYVYEVEAAAPPVPGLVAGAFERVTGYTPEEVAQAGGWPAIIHPDDRGNVSELLGELAAGRPWVSEYRIVTRDGEVRWLRDRARPVLDPETGTLLRVVGGAQDITEQRRLQDQLTHARRLDALARLAGSVAHDFNNLLMVMSAATELLPDVPEAAESKADLRDTVARAAELTRSLLVFARREPTLKRVVDLVGTARAARTMLQRAAGERVRVRVELPAHRLPVSIDSGKVDMALLNLVVNARDAMPDGGTVRVVCGSRTLGARDPHRPSELPPGDYATIAVIDEGRGISGDVRARLFEPYFTTKEPGQGTGLGLATAHGMAQQLNGALMVDSTPGVGTTFTLVLPLLPEDALGKVDPGEDRHAVGGPESVVLVEDDPLARRLVTRLVVDLGYTVTAFPSAEAALDDGVALATCDVLITDVRLPGLAGTDLAVRCVAERPELKVLLMSGYVEDPAHQRVVDSGRFAFLQKPFLPRGLARRLREVLDG